MPIEPWNATFLTRHAYLRYDRMNGGVLNKSHWRKRKMKRIAVALLVGAVASSCATAWTTAWMAAWAQDVWPSKPVTVVVPFAAGGNTDVLARIFAERMSRRLGQQFVIENKAGAGGT